jgi:hypothetical protein
MPGDQVGVARIDPDHPDVPQVATGGHVDVMRAGPAGHVDVTRLRSGAGGRKTRASHVLSSGRTSLGGAACRGLYGVKSTLPGSNRSVDRRRPILRSFSGLHRQPGLAVPRCLLPWRGPSAEHP